MKMTFTPVGMPVIPESRISWKLGFTIYAIGISNGGKSSLARLHLLHTALLKSDEIDFSKIDNEALYVLPWIFDPAINTSINVGVKEKLLLFTKEKVSLANPLGGKFFDKIIKDEVFLGCDKSLRAIVKRINETIALEILKRWGK